MRIKLFLCLLCFALFLLNCNKSKKSDDAAIEMQNFVIEVSNYTHTLNTNFIIIPQNGIELNFNNVSPEEGVNDNYITAIDGQGVEELFYNGTLQVDNERISMLQDIKGNVTVMVADHVSTNSNVPDAFQRNTSEGFIAFPRTMSNYDYLEIPDSAFNENADDITLLSDAKNYLYLISSDEFSSKQAMLTAIAATNFDIILIDLYLEEVALTSSDIAQLNTKANGGARLVIAYVNVGAAESYRYYWHSDWKRGNPKWLKKKYEGFEDEIWVEFWDQEWKDIMYGNDESYFKKILDAGFDGAYLDNVEVYYFLYFD